MNGKIHSVLGLTVMDINVNINIVDSRKRCR